MYVSVCMCVRVYENKAVQHSSLHCVHRAYDTRINPDATLSVPINPHLAILYVVQRQQRQLELKIGRLPSIVEAAVLMAADHKDLVACLLRRWLLRAPNVAQNCIFLVDINRLLVFAHVELPRERRSERREAETEREKRTEESQNEGRLSSDLHPQHQEVERG